MKVGENEMNFDLMLGHFSFSRNYFQYIFLCVVQFLLVRLFILVRTHYLIHPSQIQSFQ